MEVRNPGYQTESQAFAVEEALNLYSRDRKKLREKQKEEEHSEVFDSNYKEKLLNGE